MQIKCITSSKTGNVQFVGNVILAPAKKNRTFGGTFCGTNSKKDGKNEYIL